MKQLFFSRGINVLDSEDPQFVCRNVIGLRLAHLSRTLNLLPQATRPPLCRRGV